MGGGLMEICESSGKEGGGYQNQASANNWGGAEGSKIWSFCDNVIIELIIAESSIFLSVKNKLRQIKVANNSSQICFSYIIYHSIQKRLEKSLLQKSACIIS